MPAIPEGAALRRHAIFGLVSGSDEIQVEGIDHRGFTQRFIAAAFTTVPGTHIRVQNQSVVIGLVGTKLGHPLRGFPILHLRIM